MLLVDYSLAIAFVLYHTAALPGKDGGGQRKDGEMYTDDFA